MILQAGCVSIAGRGILIQGPPGSGKSSLALALIDRGATLVGDDGVLLEVRAGRLWALPHPNTRGLLEVRNVGLIAFPILPSARICLKLTLDAAAPRYVEQAACEIFAGTELPALTLWPDSPVLALRAELALRRYGLE